MRLCFADFAVLRDLCGQILTAKFAKNGRKEGEGRDVQGAKRVPHRAFGPDRNDIALLSLGRPSPARDPSPTGESVGLRDDAFEEGSDSKGNLL